MEKKEQKERKSEAVKECPHCKGEIHKKNDVVVCKVCGKELDEAQFWLE